MTDRTRHKMMIAMIKEHWRSIDPVWKDDPELCHALGYEAGYKDAVARRVEPRSGESGAGFESLPASPPTSTWWDEPVAKMRHEGKGLIDEEALDMARTFGAQPWPPGSCVAFARAIEAKLREKNT